MELEEEPNVIPSATLYLFTIALATYVAYYLWQRRWHYYYGSKIHGPFGLPFLGSLHLFLPHGKHVVFTRSQELASKYKPILKFWLGPKMYVMLTRPEDVESVMKKCLEKGQQYQFLKPGLGAGLLIAPVAIWKPNRKIIGPTFSQNVLNSYVSIWANNGRKTVERLRDCTKTQINFLPISNETTLANICETALGVTTDEDKRREYLKWAIRGQAIMSSRFLIPFYYSDFLFELFGPVKELRELMVKSSEYLRGILEEKRRLLRQDANDTKDMTFLTHLLRINEAEHRWSDEEMLYEIQTMMITGYESTGVSNTFVMIMLGMFQDVQEKVHQEQMEIFGDSDRDPTPDDLPNMVYLERVLRETIRLFPLIPVSMRHVDEDFVLGKNDRGNGVILRVLAGKLVIPKGTTFWIPTCYIHRDPSSWPDPLKFDPDRFLPEEVAKRHRYAYMPFSIPPRNCIGATYGLMAMKVTISSIVRNYRVVSTQYKDIQDISILVNISLTATKGYGVTLESRN